MQYSSYGLTKAWERGSTTSLDLLAMLLVMQPRTRLAFWAASAHGQLMSHLSPTSTPKSFFTRLLSIPHSVLKLGIAPTQVQDLALGLVELHEVHMGPLLQPVKVSLDGISSL